MLMKQILFTLFFLQSFALHAQTYKDSITQYREKYKQDFLEDARSPFEKRGLAMVAFF
jgi:hypothetical protein